MDISKENSILISQGAEAVSQLRSH